jgi:hypothetical protein
MSEPVTAKDPVMFIVFAEANGVVPGESFIEVIAERNEASELTSLKIAA